jgi:hypothetical protein
MVDFPTLIYPYREEPYSGTLRLPEGSDKHPGDYFNYKSNQKRIMYGKFQIDRMKKNKILVQVRNVYEYKIMEDYAVASGLKCEKYYSPILKDKKVVSAKVFLPWEDNWCSKNGIKMTHKFEPVLYALVSEN